MDLLPVVLTFVTGLGLRLALPLALTALAIALLRQLDIRWQAEAARQARRLAVAGTPCWEARSCSPEKRANCAAFQQPAIPCWQLFRDDRGELRQACLECQVFQHAPVPMPA